MGHMTAFTAMELEAARRREIVQADRGFDAHGWRARTSQPRAGQRELAWLAAAVTSAAAATKLARG